LEDKIFPPADKFGKNCSNSHENSHSSEASFAAPANPRDS